MEGLGEFLKRGREKAGISLDDLAQRTRIRVENLESLEREDLDSLPSDAYVRGFVRQVCREVGLAPNDGLVRYDILRARGAPPDEITWAEERVEDTPGRLERALEDPERVVRIARKGGRLAIGLILAALVVLGGMLARRALDRNGTEVTAAPAPVPAERTPPAPAGAEARPPTAPGPAAGEPATGRPTRAAVDTGVGALPDPAAAAPARPPASTPGPTTGPAGEPARTAAGTAAGSAAAAPGASDPRPAAASEAPPADTAGQAILELRASRAVDVTLLLDGVGAERHARLEAGERRSWKADRHFVLRASDGGALQVLLDGRSLGRAGDDGVPTFRTIGPAAR